MQRDGSRPSAARIAAGTFAAVIRAYQSSPAFAGLAPSTKRTYGDALRMAEHPEALGAIGVHVIRPALVQAFLDGLADRPGRASHARTALHAVESWALVRDLIPYPIMTGTSVARMEGGHEPWSLAQVEIAELHARPDLARVVTLAAHTGQRGSDLVRMRWSDLEDHDGYTGINVVQRKTGCRLWVPLTPELAAAIETWERKPPFFLLLNIAGQPWTRERLSGAWNNERDTNPDLAALKQAGLVIHGLRATAVVRARKAGASVLEICSMYGMTEPTVSRYSRLADQRGMALAAVHHLRTAAERAQPTISKIRKVTD